MNLLSLGYIVVAVICGTVAMQHLMVAARLRERAVHALFAATAVAAAVDALVQRRFFLPRSAAELQALFGWSAVSICVFLGLLIWFIAIQTGAVRRWFLLLETALLGLTALIDFILPYGTPAFMRVDGLREVAYPWGETIRVAIGSPSPWRIVGDIANVGFLVLLLDTTLRLLRRRQRREALLIGGCLVLLGLTVLAIIPADLGLIDLPGIHPFVFLLIVAGMSWNLSDRVAQSAILAREVAVGESRWRQLIDNAPILMILADRDGQVLFVNPHYERVTGQRRQETAGRALRDLVPEGDRERLEGAFHDVIAGRGQGEFESNFMADAGGRRTVTWRNVLLRDADGAVDGVLSLGVDLTGRREAERARDEALRDLERSVHDLTNLRQRLEEENLLLRGLAGKVEDDPSIVGSSPAIGYVLHKVRQVAPTRATVLLSGETGVGKELVARMIHRESGRAPGPFVAVNCAALPLGLVESELFGHERGSFTGADRTRRGRFEIASGGTLFLDEVGDLPLEVQPKLLRALQENQIERVGADRSLAVDVRLIAATNRDLGAEVEAGRFRRDLFYRLDVYPITVPPLRERRDDIPALVAHFVALVSTREEIRVDAIPPEVLRHLAQYDWPGNVRELQNVVERAVLRCSDGVLRLTEPLVGNAAAGPSPGGRPAALRPTLDELQRDYILQVLHECDGRLGGAGGAAEVLGVHPNTLRSRMQKLRIVANGGRTEARQPHLDH